MGLCGEVNCEMASFKRVTAKGVKEMQECLTTKTRRLKESTKENR